MRVLLRVWFALLVLGPAGAQDAAVPQPVVDPAPGLYPSPLVVSVRAPEGAEVSYRFLEASSSQSQRWTGPLILDALAGETRTYTLRLTTNLASGEAVTKDYPYEVRRLAEAEATVQPVPGTYTAAVTVRPVLPAGWSLSLDGRPAPEGELRLEAEAGSRRTFVLRAEGPRGLALAWPYTVDLRDQEKSSIEVVSPLPGRWDNAQPLVAAFQGVDRVLWSYGPHLDPSSARTYEGPVLLDRVGVQTVTLAARSRVDGHWLERSVTWTNGSASPPASNWPASGLRPEGLDLPDTFGWEESWDEGRSWKPGGPAHSERASAVSRKVLSVQLRKSGTLLRYLWWLDARQPEAPSVEFEGGWNPQLVFSGAAEALYRVTWTLSDGKTEEEAAGLWGPLGVWKVPDNVVGARLSVEGINGVAGPAVSLGFPETGWSTPGWEPWDNQGLQTDRSVLPLGGKVPPRPGFRPAYEVSDRPDVPEPGAGSPWLEGAFLPSVPWGDDRTFYVRFAWRDAAGLTGPASAVVAVRVDRIPPRAPEVEESDGQIRVRPAEGEEDGTALFWAVTTHRVDSAQALTFQPYTAALAAATLKAGAPGKLWFHAEAQDRAGNTGPPRLNVALASAGEGGVSLVQVDPSPAVGDTAVEDGGVYPWSQFRLRALEAGRELWVGVADPSSGLPTDWKTRLQPWSGLLSRSVAHGERRGFLIYWNAKTADGWAWPQPKTLTLTLDQGAPASPVGGPWPSAPLGGAWTLVLKPGRSGDHLRYVSTTDGSDPPDPLTAGEDWPGTRTWDAPPGERMVVRLRVTEVSVGGLAVEMPLPPAVTIDRTTPSAVAPALEPFTYRSTSFVVPVPATGATLRYTLTSDGSLPPVPTASSPALESSGLKLDGVAGQSLLYRFRWRPFSAAGLPGPVSDAFAVLIDRSPAPTAVVSAPDPERAVPTPRVTGFPASGVSAAAVTLRADASGVLRFEVTEGVDLPRPVTALSPVWEKPLVLDGGPGVDRLFSVAVRGYAASGQAVTDEVRYTVRVDRSVPQTPAFDLVADARRPEATLVRSPGTDNPEEVLYYRWSWESFPQGRGESDWQTPGDQAPRFSAPGGALTRLRVQAYLRDEAGNEGPVGEQTLLIDENVVYVAPQGTGDGSRDRPLASVADALDLARRGGKAVVFLGAGSYAVPRTLDLGGMNVFGGLSPGAWESTPSPARSVWTAAPGFSGGSLLESGDQAWSLSRVDLSTGTSHLASVVEVRGAAVTVRASTWNWSGAPLGWDQSGGSLDWADVSVQYAAEPRGSFLAFRSGALTARGVNLAATQNRDGVLFALQDVQGLLQDIALVSKKASGFDGIWSATGCKLTVNNARVLAGDGASRSTAFVLKDSDAVFFNTEVSLYGSSSNTGFQAAGGRLELQKSNLSLLRGEEFNQGIVVDQGEAVLGTFQIKVESGAYQGGFSLEGGSLVLEAGRVQIAGGGQRAWGAQFLGVSRVTMDGVTWSLGIKTPGDLWKLDQPWSEGSRVTGSVTQGW